jgi:class 3 adenylate cyclase
LCTLIVRYFTMEVVTRPVLEKLSGELPSDFTIRAPGLPIRWRLIAAAPIINIITGVVVAGLSAEGHHAELSDLGLSWVIAVVVSCTISLELVVLVVRSLGSALEDLRRATERIAAGDYSARLPVVATDETGKLAQSFNAMAEGLEERERLREAFGAYVDPELADRVLVEGADLEGEEVEVSILFIDIRNFTAFAERSSPQEVVSMLNGFWELVVPVLLRHGGHANKFIGDGLLAVFGAPDRLEDHADRALAAALEIVDIVAGRYGDEVRIGAGINSGSVVVGTVGGGGRVEFAVIGDVVNTAARVEAATRETGDDVLITDATRTRLDTDLELEERPPVPLKGKSVTVRLWAPRATATTVRGRDVTETPRAPAPVSD